MYIENDPRQPFQAHTKKFLARQVSPLVGLIPEILYISRSARESRMMTTTGDLTGVHILSGGKVPKPGEQHIGSNGIYQDEVMIRILAETIERYAQMTSEVEMAGELVFGTMADLQAQGKPTIGYEKLQFFSAQQLARESFPFQQFTTDTPLTWLKVNSMVTHSDLWVPAQLLLVGYQVKLAQKEPWLSSAVTTGTATHTQFPLALRSALLELIQIDTAIGFWHTNTKAIEIKFDHRTRHLNRLIEKYAPNNYVKPTFYWLPSPDFTGAYIACVISSQGIPRIAVGLGADTALVPAMYKAYLEANSILPMSIIKLYQEQTGTEQAIDDPTMHYNLDSNVTFYAKGGDDEILHQKFFSADNIQASALPDDMEGSASDHVRTFTQQFSQSGKALLYLDLTCQEAKELGFVVSRVWSPDTLSLPLPSAVPVTHPRFSDYGGITHETPHPFP